MADRAKQAKVKEQLKTTKDSLKLAKDDAKNLKRKFRDFKHRNPDHELSQEHNAKALKMTDEEKDAFLLKFDKLQGVLQTFRKTTAKEKLTHLPIALRQ